MDPLVLMLNIFRLDGRITDPSQRNDHPILRLEPQDTSNGIGLDTCWTSDYGWETGLLAPNGRVYIIQRYEKEDEAVKGHMHWINVVSKIKKRKKFVTLGFDNKEEMVTIKVG